MLFSFSTSTAMFDRSFANHRFYDEAELLRGGEEQHQLTGNFDSVSSINSPPQALDSLRAGNR